MKKKLLIVIVVIALFLTTSVSAQVNLFTSKSNIYKAMRYNSNQEHTTIVFDTTKSLTHKLKAIKKDYKNSKKGVIIEKNNKLEGLDKAAEDFDKQEQEILDDYNSSIKEVEEWRLRAYSKLYYQYVQSNGLNFIPTRNRVFTQLYYSANTDKSVETLRNGYLNFNTSGRSSYTEFIAGYLPIGRLSFGGQYSYTDLEQASPDSITNKSASDVTSYLQRVQDRNGKKTTIQNFLGGGGNAILNFSIPVLAYEDHEVKFDLGFSERLNFNIPKISSSLQNPTYFYDTGMEFAFAYDLSASKDNPFGFFTKARASWISGDDKYYTSLGIKQGFGYYDLALGLNLFNQFRVAYYFTNTTDPKLSFPSYLTVTFMPTGR